MAEIEQRLAERDAQVIDAAEAADIVAQMASAYLTALDALPRRLTPNPHERHRIAAIISSERQRLAAAFAAIGRSLQDRPGPDENAL